MARLFNLKEDVDTEGFFFNAWLRRRLLEKNQNALVAITGGTGSGKTYWGLSACENYYTNVLKKPFPIENVVFSPLQLVQRLRYFEENNLEGELILPDEWGVNNSSHDWQSKTQKLLGYVMQSFRSMNVGLIFTLPVLTMLNKSTRLLLHAHFITAGIDYNFKRAKVKPLMHQLNQTSGKSFWKYPKIVIGRVRRKIQRLEVSLPSKELIEAYEIKKKRFVAGGIMTLEDELQKEFDKKYKREERPALTPKQLQAFKLLEEGMTEKDIAIKLGKAPSTIWQRLELARKKGYVVPLVEN